ncbi:MAG TPA: hypothetical protein VN764_14025, partial [Polyangiaceae bacterium]|nr:hypothetical protein [Polyangiaceae bacterium]
MIRAIRRNTVLTIGWGVSQLGCAPKSQVQAPAPEISEASAPSAEPSSNESTPDATEADMMAQIAEQERLADAEAEAGPASDEYVPREVVYRISPEGLKIQVDGAEFRPKAESVKIKGGYGVVITVEASSNTPLVLLNPTGGPLAFGGVVRRPDQEKITDTRKGEDEIHL